MLFVLHMSVALILEAVFLVAVILVAVILVGQVNSQLCCVISIILPLKIFGLLL